MKPTAVEFLQEQLFIKIEGLSLFQEILYQAKEMEKQQIVDAVLYGFREDAEAFDWKGDKYNSEQYYNETFKNK